MSNNGSLENLFKLQENNTDVKTEVIAGFTTFMTMAYIIFVNPTILSDAGMPFDGVFIATIMGAVLGTMAMALLSNYPFALASGMGLNAFFAYSVVIGMGVSWQAALGIIFLEGVIFIILSVTPVREMIVNSIPMALKTGISTGIGLFIAFIGLQNAEIVVNNDATLVGMGNLLEGSALVALFGLIFTGILHAKKVKGALLWGILASTVFGWFNGVTPAFNGVVAMPKMSDWSGVLFQLDIGAALNVGMIGVILSFLFVDMFDTAGTLVGVSQQAGYIDENGDLPKASRALLADAIGTTGGALFGTSTVTTYVESASGVAEGGRTGLTGVVVSILFFLSLFFKPLIAIVPGAATAPALIIVGTMMMTNITALDWDDFTEILPAFIAMIAMPLTYSISNGIALGFIVYPLVKLFTGKGKDVHWLVYVLGVVFVFYFVFH
ncbi:MAG: putative MFS transporter, AGZA family, xanthine/uracil permease [Halanaerobium sp. 4-GBenrich]|jgi:AGZA family xanthine/uracil permease-like MFS transporter|uniref:AGZA family xanthine/uracil permease-like MFS transporter n=1 Tax=Halanaerobium congolense TaxID=54121 RepID=A0A1G6R8Y4_9FIRM|nr:NCS2 family permease [Halanaerobium congolense]KXS49429.1 MAG: putative MFS transporter, AGZA family, xanthine/uracil permease [Halanaerobium sp. T82-1]ODS49640.1 MAG: putative MFS transporter, AGZA family, xanthine/uracil permease [Halanaerobium sp. 4-GBenrich]OEG62152.1 MAG: guanine permease [Halanaerobium sp. MDAL1]PUU92467.1 MAG: putative MFS transporter, AGZA family, xanthine/uracil permease [Halanaerobium sp.]PTX16265.1 LOW QUALITY PROTEIN: AGZA family xanthine/uracil permease-like MF